MEAETIYKEIGEGYGFNGSYEDAIELIETQLTLYANRKNAQLLEKNKELREVLEDMIRNMESARMIGNSEMKKIDSRAAPLWRKAFAKIWNRANKAIKIS